jgi:hypothetical protein
VIPALLALPAATSIVGGVVGGVMNAFAPSSPTPAAPPFSPYIDKVATPTAAAPSLSRSGMLRSEEWGQMDNTTLKTWAQGLSGHHIDATDSTGRTISGVVGNVSQLGNNLTLSVGGHLVSLSQLKQITWSSAAV